MKKQLFLGCMSLIMLAESCQKEIRNQQDVQKNGSIQNASSSVNSATNALLSVNVPLSDWMSQLSDNKLLSAISIPGTHDAGARFETFSGTAKCQNLTISEQLNNGVRYLDIRCRHINNAFAIHHGSVYQNLNFQDVINASLQFLNTHPTEAIIMSVKEEYDPSNNTRTFEQTFDSYIQQNPSKWDLTASIPTIGSIRGKIKLFRRFGATNLPKGIDATNWADNTTFTISNTSGNIKIQDFYKINTPADKWTAIQNIFDEASTQNPNTLYLNYCSGYKPGLFSIPSITTISNYVNPKVITYLTGKKGRFGIVPQDFIDSTRSAIVVRTNF